PPPCRRLPFQQTLPEAEAPPPPAAAAARGLRPRRQLERAGDLGLLSPGHLRLLPGHPCPVPYYHQGLRCWQVPLLLILASPVRPPVAGPAAAAAGKIPGRLQIVMLLWRPLVETTTKRRKPALSSSSPPSSSRRRCCCWWCFHWQQQPVPSSMCSSWRVVLPQQHRRYRWSPCCRRRWRARSLGGGARTGSTR
ncbi:unnamed protein product, partial [Ectocarpus sp. 8 AP-2014]